MIYIMYEYIYIFVSCMKTTALKFFHNLVQLNRTFNEKYMDVLLFLLLLLFYFSNSEIHHIMNVNKLNPGA